jgi:hypothetical protein
MTDADRPTDWPDARLTKAFRARADAHRTPSDLSEATMERVRRAYRREASRHRYAYLGGLVAAAAMVAIAVALVMRPATDRAGDDTTPALGLPLLRVTDAMSIRDAGVDDRELAVAGFLSGSAPMMCPFDPSPPNPTYLRCSPSWLMEMPESLITVNEGVVSGRGPTGPALHPSFAEVGQPPARPFSRQGKSTPTAVVLIGHFDDRRSVLCPARPIPACADTFVVDRVASVEGSPMAPHVRLDLEPIAPEPRHEPTWTPDDVERLLMTAVPNLEILSRVALPGHRIGELEPSLGTGILGIIHRPIAWVVTGLDRTADGPPMRRTFLLVDGSDEAYETVPWDVEPSVGFAPFTLVPPLPSPEG